MQFFLYTLVILSLFTLSVIAQSYVTPAPRRSPSCALLDNGKIHCFGGQIRGGQTRTIDTTLLTLDISEVRENYAKEWEIISNSVNSELFTMYPREKPIVAATDDKKNMVISGGHSQNKSASYVQTILYNVDTNAWRALPTFDDGVNGNSRKIFRETLTWVPEQSKLYLFGGTESDVSHPWYYDSVLDTNLTNVVLSEHNETSKIGYYRMTTLDIATDAANPWQVPTQQNPPLLSYNKQSTIYHPASKKIFFFGGVFNNVTTERFERTKNTSMSEILTFDTVNGVWETQIFTGDLIPSPRRYHTTTLLPSGEDMLLYGGAPDEGLNSLQDFCYTANLKSFVWSSCNTISLPNNASPLRSEHAAVLDESKHLLYVLFGVQDTKYDLNTFDTVLMLNVTDPQNIKFATAKDTADNSNSNNKSINSGVIVGAAVGGSAGALLIIGILALLIIIKKRANKKKKQQNEEKAEPLSVDWDAIETRFIETNAIPEQSLDTKQHLIMKDDSTLKDSTANKTLVVPDGGNTIKTKPDENNA